jgi:hypothetical protein
MKRKLETLLAVAALLAPGSTLFAGEVEKKPLNLDEISSLISQEQTDKPQIEKTEAGLNDGAGLFAAGIVALIILVVHSY